MTPKSKDWELGRQRAIELAKQHIEDGTPLDWFEELYAAAAGNLEQVPWEDQRPQPLLVEWLAREAADGTGSRALVVGSGLGDDCEELARRGYQVTGFDLSATAVAWAGQRFPDSPVTYVQADLFELPGAWRRSFDLVVEVYTLQALPLELRERAAACLADCVAPGGRLVAVLRGRDEGQAVEQVPWPLTRTELGFLEHDGLVLEQFEDLMDDEDPPVRRFRASFKRPE